MPARPGGLQPRARKQQRCLDALHRTQVPLWARWGDAGLLELDQLLRMLVPAAHLPGQQTLPPLGPALKMAALLARLARAA